MFIVYGGLVNIADISWEFDPVKWYMINPDTLKFKPRHITDSNGE
jgi:hypothetical protein